MVQVTLDECPDEHVLEYISDAESEEFDIPKPVMNEEFPRTIFFCNAPVTTAEKIPKMTDMIKAICHKAIQDDQQMQEIKIEFPQKEDGSTFGCGFVTYRSKAAAAMALDYFGDSGFKFGKSQVHVRRRRSWNITK